MTVLAVTGLTKEAEIAGVAGVIAVAGGGDAAGLAQKLAALHGDIRAVISIGLGGALAPHLKVGDIVIGDHVFLHGKLGEAEERFDCDATWRVRIASRLGPVHQGPVAGSDAIIADADSKRRLYDLSGALAVDMESHVAARFAAKRQVPFAVLRVISDDAGHDLPPAVMKAMKPDGGIAVWRVMGSILRRPWQVPALIRTARGSNKAFAELLRCRDLLGVGLAGADL
jgi:hopanoid-associated phosphorylase